MVSKLFMQLNQINVQIEKSINEFELARLNKLDEQYIETWEEICNYQPSSHDEAKLMVLHLLNQLADHAEEGQDYKNIRMKILELFSHQAWYEQPHQAYGT